MNMRPETEIQLIYPKLSMQVVGQIHFRVTICSMVNEDERDSALWQEKVKGAAGILSVTVMRARKLVG